jgi:hypothetical protein
MCNNLMGWHQVSASIVGKRSAHNSINDELDSIRMEWFIKEVRGLAQRSEYQPLDIVVTDFQE